jgi:hypothetical protein
MTLEYAGQAGWRESRSRRFVTLLPELQRESDSGLRPLADQFCAVGIDFAPILASGPCQYKQRQLRILLLDVSYRDLRAALIRTDQNSAGAAFIVRYPYD